MGRVWVRTHGREFFAGHRPRDCLSRFSVHFFRRFFLNRMGRFLQAAGRPLSASMPNRAKSGIHARFPLSARILLRKTPPETKHGKFVTGNPAADAPQRTPARAVYKVSGGYGVTIVKAK